MLMLIPRVVTLSEDNLLGTTFTNSMAFPPSLSESCLENILQQFRRIRVRGPIVFNREVVAAANLFLFVLHHSRHTVLSYIVSPFSSLRIPPRRNTEKMTDVSENANGTTEAVREFHQSENDQVLHTQVVGIFGSTHTALLRGFYRRTAFPP